MAKTEKEAYDGILSHIQKQGGKFSDWYCGITKDIDARLFGDHKVPKKDHWYTYRECNNADAARGVEKDLLGKGCDGGTGGGGDDAVYVYAYLKTDVTAP